MRNIISGDNTSVSNEKVLKALDPLFVKAVESLGKRMGRLDSVEVDIDRDIRWHRIVSGPIRINLRLEFTPLGMPEPDENPPPIGADW